jgi:hypothetical protein
MVSLMANLGGEHVGRVLRKSDQYVMCVAMS